MCVTVGAPSARAALETFVSEASLAVVLAWPTPAWDVQTEWLLNKWCTAELIVASMGDDSGTPSRYKLVRDCHGRTERSRLHAFRHLDVAQIPAAALACEVREIINYPPLGRHQ